MSHRGCMRRKVILCSTVTMAAAVTIGTALPVGASPSPAAAPAARAAGAPGAQGVTAMTPGCIVQGAVMYPLFITMVMVLNPTAIPSAPSEYWNGSERSPGRLKACGI